jgi:hypothetical protein
MLIFRRSKLYFYSIWYRHSVSGRALDDRSQRVAKLFNNRIFHCLYRRIVWSMVRVLLFGRLRLPVYRFQTSPHCKDEHTAVRRYVLFYLIQLPSSFVATAEELSRLPSPYLHFERTFISTSRFATFSN